MKCCEMTKLLRERNIARPGRYVTGDFRFRAGYCKSNPRKMVKL